jgi:hypothetical protein
MQETFQAYFHRRWNHLNDPHVRSLAWLLDAPDLLDPMAARWKSRIATLPADAGANAADWLAGLDRAPDDLHAWLELQPFSRLGRYAEKLMSFYFQHQGVLAAHGVQVRTDSNETVGEFDFLLWQGEALLHREFATKFYLFNADNGAGGMNGDADYFIGPNLADTLGAKMEKILDRQLALAQHPAAQAVLPQPVASAQALIKGWLFYPDDAEPPTVPGLTHDHCRGFWCAHSQFGTRAGHSERRYAVLPRLRWLAPARLEAAQGMDHAALMQAAASHFSNDAMPLMVAVLEPQGALLLEVERGFMVPDDWRSRAGRWLEQKRVVPR